MLFEEFKRNLKERPDEAAFLIAAGDRSLPISWRQFMEDISVLAWGIRRYSPGGVIGLLGENSYEWISVHAACLFSGACVVPMDTNLSAEEIAERLKKVGVKVLVYSSLYDEKVCKVRKLMPALTVAGFGSVDSDAFLDMGRKAMAAGDKSVFELPPPDSEKTSMIMFTSGTTSEPRGVELTISGIEFFCRNVRSRLDLSPGGRSLMLLPVHHVFGICATYAMLVSGVALGVCPDYRRLYDAVERFRADFVFLVPALADILATKIKRRSGSGGADTSAVKWLCIGGAPLSLRTHKKLSELGINVLMAYGLTETTALYSLSDRGRETPPGSAGDVCTLAGVETKVSPAGELMIRGPNVFKGYYGDPERTAEVKSPDGWFRTGDIGRIDDGGRVWITGRASRTIVLSSGKKVAPEELEAKILLHPGICEVVVSGGADREIVAEVYSVLSDGEVHNVISVLNGSLPVYMRIKRIVCRNKPFPRTASGKISLPRTGMIRKSRKRTSMDWIFTVGIAAIFLSVVNLMVCDFVCENPSAPEWQRSLMHMVEMSGEVLLGVFAIGLIVIAGRSFRRRR